jgi:hypothetical protein
MEIIQQGIGHDLDRRDGAGNAKVATYDPGYEECSKTACQPPAQGFDYATGMAVIQDPSLCGF